MVEAVASSLEHPSGLTPFAEILRSVLEGVRAIAEADVERAGGFRGPVTEEQRYASNTIDLAHRALDRLTLWREADEELEQARAQGERQ